MIHAESCGFDWVGCNEHHFSPYGMMANCNLIGGALAYPTKRVKIAMIGNPRAPQQSDTHRRGIRDARLHERGRLVAGLMRASRTSTSPTTFRPANPGASARGGAADPQGLDRARALRLGRQALQYRQISIWPKPLQKPHPPLVISASNADSAKFAAEMRATMGMVLLADLPSGKECIRIYKETAKASGWEPNAENILVGMHTCIAETDEEARRHLEQGSKYFDQVLMGGLQASQRIVLQKTRYFENEESRDRWKSRSRQAPHPHLGRGD